MPRKRRTSFLEDVYDTATQLPWWAGIALAALSFTLGHMLAGTRAANPRTPEAMVTSVVVALGIAIEYLGPLVFLLAAARSGFRQMQERRPERSSPTPSPIGSGPTIDRTTRMPDDNLYDAWKDVSRTEPSRPPVDTSRWSMELLKALEWKRFELLCAAYFETLGFKARVAREGADGGIDIHLYPEGSDTPGIVVQCKAWNAYQVGVKPIRELLGVMTAARISEGVFVTTSDFTDEARRFAEGNNLQLIDGEDFLKKIAATSPERQAALLQSATAGDFTTPTCPSCGIKMVERVAQKTGERFWGCTRFPSCRTTFRMTSG
jgi:restriction system protein